MNITNNRNFWWLVYLLCVGIMIVGCVPEKTTKKEKDPFFEKWETLAAKSKGHSPTPMAPSIGSQDRVTTKDLRAGESEMIPTKPLPAHKVSLKMRQADVKAVLRSLARTAGQNIIIKNDVKGDITVDFDGVPWDQAFNSILRTNGLSYVWEGDIIRVVTNANLEQDSKMILAKERQMTMNLLTKVVYVNYAKAKDISVNLQEFLKDKEGKPRGMVKVDEYSNSLIIQASEADLNRILPLIERVDKPTSQILIKCNIVETTKDMARSLGIQWGGMFHSRVFGGNRDFFLTPGGSGGSSAVPVAPANPPLTGGAATTTYNPVTGQWGLTGQGMGISFPVTTSQITTAGGVGSVGFILGNISENVLEMQLTALQTDGKIRILSSPSITTLDNQKAFTENGMKVPYSTLDTSVTPPTRTVKFEDAVLRLEITPHVIDGKNLKMELIVKKDEVDFTHNVEGNPFIIKKQTSTTLIVEDGETIVISGLTKQKLSDGTSGVPVLKDMPVLGWMFKREDKEDHMEEVLIFITPSILPFRTAAATIKISPEPEKIPAK